MKKPRKSYTPDEKVAIIRRHLMDDIAVSDLCDEYQIRPNLYYRWQKEFFDGGAVAFAREADHQVAQLKKQLAQVEQQMTRKNEVLSESGAEYKSVINYTLAIVENRIKKIFRDYRGIKEEQGLYRELLKSIHSIIDFSFFIYSVAPRANTTIKLSRVLKIIIDFTRTESISADDMHQLFKRISDKVLFIILKYETNNHTQVETLYLLTVMAELGKDYWIDESSLLKYFGGKIKSKKTVYFENDLNYFSLTVLLFYIKNKKRYERIKLALKTLILNKLKSHLDSLQENTECLLLTLDCISCPYLDKVFKKKILRLHGIGKAKLQIDVIEYRENWFTKWTNFEFAKELDAKQSEEVY